MAHPGKFRMCTSLKALTIHNGLKKIGGNAFYSCTSLESVSLPATLSFIDSAAFSNCGSLKSIVIPRFVTTIESSAFQECAKLEILGASNNALTSLTLPASAPDLRYLDVTGNSIHELDVSGSPLLAETAALTSPTPYIYWDEANALNWIVDERGLFLAVDKTVTAPKSKSAKKLTISATIKVKGKTYKVTAIKASAFKGVYKKATVKVPAKKLKAYKTLLKKGLPKTAKVKK